VSLLDFSGANVRRSCPHGLWVGRAQVASEEVFTCERRTEKLPAFIEPCIAPLTKACEPSRGCSDYTPCFPPSWSAFGGVIVEAVRSPVDSLLSFCSIELKFNQALQRLKPHERLDACVRNATRRWTVQSGFRYAWNEYSMNKISSSIDSTTGSRHVPLWHELLLLKEGARHLASVFRQATGLHCEESWAKEVLDRSFTGGKDAHAYRTRVSPATLHSQLAWANMSLPPAMHQSLVSIDLRQTPQT